MKTNLLRQIFLFFSTSIIIVSCDQISIDQPALDTDAVKDNARTERALGDIFSAVDVGANAVKASNVCPSAVYDFGTNILTLDYGTEGCIGVDGILRSGIITANFTNFNGWLNGTSAVISFDNYAMDGDQLTGVVTITSHIVNQIISFTIEGTDMVLLLSDGTDISWNSNSTMTLNSVNSNGKYWSISGNASGISRSGKNFTRLTENVLTDPTCKWFVGGKITITVEDVVDLLTFGECGTVSIKHNNLPAIQVNLNSL